MRAPLPLGLLLCATLLAAPATAQNLFKRRRNARPLIADHSARATGDILTVIVRENHKVKNEDKIDRSNESNLTARLNAFTLDNAFSAKALPRLDVRQNRAMKGEAKQEKDTRVEARIAVIVIDTLPNGNLVVAGTRIVKVDDEEKTLRISGIVRQLDVTKDNTVTSSSVADARVSITSKGGNARMVTKGPIAAMFDALVWAAWPF